MFPKLLELREHAGLPAVEILPHAEDEPIFSDETFGGWKNITSRYGAIP